VCGEGVNPLFPARRAGAHLKQQLKDKLMEHKQQIDKYGEELREARNWKWQAGEIVGLFDN